jgi:hypothetical protein
VRQTHDGVTIGERVGGAWKAWRRLARRIGDAQARVLLTVFYFVVLGPFALALRWRSDPLAIKPGAPAGWRPRREPEEPLLVRAQRQS